MNIAWLWKMYAKMRDKYLASLESNVSV